MDYSVIEEDMIDLLNKIATVRIKSVQSVDYNGVDIDEPVILAIDTTIKEAFTKEDLQRRKENGQNKLQVFINKLFQLGYAQGYKRAKEEHTRFLNLF
jgi:flagellar biosynthesis/type III secretory pathway protein FliH